MKKLPPRFEKQIHDSVILPKETSYKVINLGEHTNPSRWEEIFSEIRSAFIQSVFGLERQIDICHVVVILYYPLRPEVKANQSERFIQRRRGPNGNDLFLEFCETDNRKTTLPFVRPFITTPSHDSLVIFAEFVQLTSAFIIKTENRLSWQRLSPTTFQSGPNKIIISGKNISCARKTSCGPSVASSDFYVYSAI